MRAAAASAAIALLAGGCGSAPGPAPLRVAEVVPQIRALNGKTVSVGGYLGECAGYECRLFVDEAGWHEFGRTVQEMFRSRRPVRWPTHLGIGTGEITGNDAEFDRKAKSFLNSYVIITGTISDQCRDEHNEPGCLDRGADLEPTDIRAWTPTKGAPANIH